MTPIGIAGERITEADIPEAAWCRVSSGSIGFRFPDCWYHIEGGMVNGEMSRFHYTVARCRCYFLDKAEATAPKCTKWSGMMFTKESGFIECRETVPEMQQLHARYLASAAKWARIGRAKA